MNLMKLGVEVGLGSLFGPAGAAAAPVVELVLQGKNLEKKLGPILKQVGDQVTGQFSSMLKDLQGILEQFPPRAGLGSFADSSSVSSVLSGGNQLQDRLLSLASGLDGEMNDLMGQLDKKDLSQQDYLRISTRLNQILEMFKMISSMLKDLHEASQFAIQHT